MTEQRRGDDRAGRRQQSVGVMTEQRVMTEKVEEERLGGRRQSRGVITEAGRRWQSTGTMTEKGDDDTAKQR